MPFCKTDGGTFCADFDDPGAAPFGGGANISDGGAAFEDDSGPISPPNAMRFTLTRPLASDYPDGGCAYVVLQSGAFDLATSGLGAEFRIKVTKPPASGSIALGPSLRFLDDAGSRCDVFFGIIANGGVQVAFDTGGSTDYALLGRKPVPGQWAHVEIDIHASGTSRAISVRIDGASAGPEVPFPSACQARTRFHGVDLGLFCVGESVGGDLDVSYDDIRVIAR